MVKINSYSFLPFSKPSPLTVSNLYNLSACISCLEIMDGICFSIQLSILRRAKYEFDTPSNFKLNKELCFTFYELLKTRTVRKSDYTPALALPKHMAGILDEKCREEEKYREEQIGECPFSIPRYNLSL